MAIKKRAYVSPLKSNETRFCRTESLLLDCFRLWSQSSENYTYLRGLMAREFGSPHADRASKGVKLLAHVLGAACTTDVLFDASGKQRCYGG